MRIWEHEFAGKNEARLWRRIQRNLERCEILLFDWEQYINFADRRLGKPQ